MTKLGGLSVWVDHAQERETTYQMFCSTIMRSVLLWGTGARLYPAHWALRCTHPPDVQQVKKTALLLVLVFPANVAMSVATVAYPIISVGDVRTRQSWLSPAHSRNNYVRSTGDQDVSDLPVRGSTSPTAVCRSSARRITESPTLQVVTHLS